MDRRHDLSIAELTREVVEAIRAETEGYLAAGEAGLSDEAADALTSRVNQVERALVAVTRETVEAEILATGDMDYINALALLHRRWLVMEGAYRDPESATECRLVDELLALSCTFGDVPMLWPKGGEHE